MATEMVESRETSETIGKMALLGAMTTDSNMVLEEEQLQRAKCKLITEFYTMNCLTFVK
jgi:hypothetical protein